MEDIRERLEGEVVLITGAAGSIGSELCRQVARVKPRAIVALDAAETPLFYIAAEMREKFPNVPFHAEIGNIQNRGRLEEVFSTFEPSVVYHAAAYKHVPLMEANVFEAVENNVFGTFTLANTAADFGVETFVMISSDKAVCPTNVMGVTKRVAELLIRSLQNRGTQFVSVRFGNVLGSQGSVVPSFKKQIAAGGPVTVTHPEMRRYFMTIPEAVQLVLQASTMGNGGEIFVLDMGQPVKIVDLARNLILLSGLQPDKDIKITFTGIRPGEKLYEELSTYEEHTLPTCHEKIKIFAGNGIAERMTSRVKALRELCERRDRRGVILELQDIVPEYTPSTEVLPEAAETPARCRLVA
jgi:FlaA1/EpsC-like NDP-sugar epimerase